MRTRALLALAALAPLACHATERSGVPAGAKLLYQVDFSAPEQKVGQPTEVAPEGKVQQFPSHVPSQIFFGRPTVVPKLCGLEQQPLQLAVRHGTQDLEGVEFLLDQIQSHYRVELDLCIAQLGVPPLPSQKTQLAVFLDIPEAYALGFMSGGEIGVVDPSQPDTVESPKLVARWEPNKPLHLAFDFDRDTQRWQASVDGKQVYDGPVQLTIPRAVRVVIRGNPQNEAAFDNFVVWGEREIEDSDAVPPPETGPEK